LAITFEDLSVLLESYRSCGLTDTRDFSFIESVVKSGQMPRGRGIDWLERIVSAGPPVDKLSEIVAIEELAAKSHRKDTADVLLSFAARLRNGHSLSERQLAFLETLKIQVTENKPDVELSDRQQALLKFLMHVKKANYYYWSGRPGISGRLDRIFLRLSRETAISQDDLEYVRQNFKGIIHDFEEGGLRHPVGKLRWLGDGSAVTVMENAVIPDGNNMLDYKNGVIQIGVYHPTKGVIYVPIRSLYIRPPKKPCN
jgi:hypothetical protein